MGRVDLGVAMAVSVLAMLVPAAVTQQPFVGAGPDGRTLEISGAPIHVNGVVSAFICHGVHMGHPRSISPVVSSRSATHLTPSMAVLRMGWHQSAPEEPAAENVWEASSCPSKTDVNLSWPLQLLQCHVDSRPPLGSASALGLSRTSWDRWQHKIARCTRSIAVRLSEWKRLLCR